MASRRNSISMSSEYSNGARSATPRPGGFIKIPDRSKTNGNGTDSKLLEVQMSRSRAQMLRSIQTFYTPKTRCTDSKTKDVAPCARRVSPCLPSCTSIAAASSGSEDELAGTDSGKFPVCQDGDLNNILGVVISTVMVLAEGKHSCSNDHLLWTAHFLETIKDEHGRVPPNVAGILNYIKYIRLKEEKGSEEDKTEEKETDKSKSSKDDEEAAKTSAGGDDDEANKSTDAPAEKKVEDDAGGKSEERPSSADSSGSAEKGERRNSPGTEEKKRERRRSSDGSTGSGGRRRSLEGGGGGSRRGSRVSFEDETPTRGEIKAEAKKGNEEDTPPPLVEES